MSQTIIVTGASAGIGLAIAKYLLSLSAKHRVICCCNSNVAPVRALAEQSSNSNRVFVVKGDMGDPKFVDTVLAQSLLHLDVDRIDAVVLNHGTLGSCARIADMKWDEWENVMRVNVGSYVAMIQHLIPYLRESQGRVIMTSSGAAENACTSWGAYGASKAACNHLAKTLAKEEPSITTVAIRPGMVDTQMQTNIREQYLHNMDEDDQVKFTGAHKNGKLLRPEQPGHVIAKLAVDTGLSRKGLSGSFLSWSDEKLEEYQDNE